MTTIGNLIKNITFLNFFPLVQIKVLACSIYRNTIRRQLANVWISPFEFVKEETNKYYRVRL